MKILYWYYKSRMNKKGVAPIRMRITIDGERADLKTGIEIQEEKWDTEEQRVKGIDELTNEYNNTLITLRYWHGSATTIIGEIVIPIMLRLLNPIFWQRINLTILWLMLWTIR